MKLHAFLLTLGGMVATPAIAEVYDCKFDVKDRFKQWVPTVVRITNDADLSRVSVSAELFDRHGKHAILGKLGTNNDRRATFRFQYNNSDIPIERKYNRKVLGLTTYSVTIQKADHSATFRANPNYASDHGKSFHGKGSCVLK